MKSANHKSPAIQDVSTTQTPASEKIANTKLKRATKKQLDQRKINWAIYQLNGIHLILPLIRSIPLEIAYQQFKDAKNNLLAELKKEHLK